MTYAACMNLSAHIAVPIDGLRRASGIVHGWLLAVAGAVRKRAAVPDVKEVSALPPDWVDDGRDVDYEDVARKLIVYSRSLAKGSLSTVGGASVGEAPVLQFLANTTDEVIPSEIAKKLSFSRARMSHILDALEGKGFITREQDANDRRRVIVRITDTGREHAEKKNAESVSSLAKQLSALGEHDAIELVRILNKAYSITYDKDDYLDSL